MNTPQHTTANRTEREPILQIRDARVTYPMERGDARVLNDINLDLHRGEIVGLVGESGSGKSTLAKAILNSVPEPGITSGQVQYIPKDDSQESVNVLSTSGDELKRIRWNGISMVFQGAMNSFNPTISIREHFLDTFDAHDVKYGEGLDRAKQLLEDFYLDPERVLDSYAHELSGGMRQRALLALGLVLDPDILILDEPTAALDLLMQRGIISLLSDIRDKYELTMLFITHDLALVTDLADRIAIMYAFNIVERGPTHTILNNAAHPYTRALLNAVPNLSIPVDEMRAIEGSSPDPMDHLTGCSYRPRCPLADSQCEDIDPDLNDIGEDHAAACHYWEETRTEIPLITAGETTDE